MVKSSIYNHFENKQDIRNTLLDEMIACYDAHFGSSAHFPPVPDSLEALIGMIMRLVDFTVHDDVYEYISELHGKPFQTTDLKLLKLERIRLYPLKHSSERRRGGGL